MAKLTKEMKTMFEQQLSVIATASKDGIPNIGPKGSMYIFDDETLVYSEGTGEKTLKNLQQNPIAAVMVVDREKTDGYQVKGPRPKGQVLKYKIFSRWMAKGLKRCVRQGSSYELWIYSE